MGEGAAGPGFEAGLTDPESVVLADFPHRQQTRFVEHAFDLLVRLLRNAERGSAHQMLNTIRCYFENTPSTHFGV